MDMKTGGKILFAAVLAVAMCCFVMTSCTPEEEPAPDFSDFDSLGYEINDSITVHFGDTRWTTLEYTSRMEHDELLGYDWIYVETHKPDSRYPAIRMKFFQGEGAHSGVMTINDVGLGYTVPGALYGDAQCGFVFYYENGVVHSPDGTVTSDWWPLNITMEVLRYNDSTRQATAYIHGTVFDYESWANREVANVEDCETREFTITFGDLPIAQ